MSRETMLSTIDNPFNYFKEFDDWFNFDCQKGYYSCSKLARLTNFTENMSQKEIDEEIERAIDAFLEVDFTGMFCKVEKESSDSKENNKDLDDDEEITIE